MCWNKEISLATFIIAIIGCVFLYKRNGPNDRWIAIFGATIAMIQLAEFFMWIDPTCGKMNKYASIFALATLIMLPIMGMIGGIKFSDSSQLLTYALMAYIVFLTFFLINYQNNSFCGSSPCQNNNFCSDKFCNLHWSFTENVTELTNIIWALFLMLPFVVMKPIHHAVVITSIGIMTLLISIVSNVSAYASPWCWLAIIIIYAKIFMKN
jgi:hypothetical protein